jgi:hypothetical protein
MEFKKKLIIGKKFMRCYNSKLILKFFSDFICFSLNRKLVVPGDLRSYGGGNGLPRAVRQSPNFSRIIEEADEPEEEEEEEEENQNDVTTILVSFSSIFNVL